MANAGYTSKSDRLDCEGGPTGTQRRRCSDPTGEPFAADPETTLQAETWGPQYRQGGWDKYERPSGNEGPVPYDELHQTYARGGNADRNIAAQHPGGTVA
jgi:hypothetical protein